MTETIANIILIAWFFSPLVFIVISAKLVTATYAQKLESDSWKQLFEERDAECRKLVEMLAEVYPTQPRPPPSPQRTNPPSDSESTSDYTKASSKTP